MPGVLSFPFSLTPQGHAATTPHGSDQEIEEAIAVLTLTLAGERIMAPEFGISDPTWGSLSLNDLETGIADYGPAGVVIHSLEEEPLTETQSAYTINWSRDPVDNEAL